MNPGLSEHGIGLIAHVQESCCRNELIAEKAKRTRVALTIGEKLEIIKSISAGSSYTAIAEKYGTCNTQSTVASIKKDASEHSRSQRKWATERQHQKRRRLVNMKSLTNRCVCMCIVIVLNLLTSKRMHRST